jgi:hypothetical protein
MKFLSNSIKEAIAFIEVLELSSNNEHIKNLQETAFKELKEFIAGADANWLINFVIKAREDASQKHL